MFDLQNGGAIAPPEHPHLSLRSWARFKPFKHFKPSTPGWVGSFKGYFFQSKLILEIGKTRPLIGRLSYSLAIKEIGGERGGGGH